MRPETRLGAGACLLVAGSCGALEDLGQTDALKDAGTEPRSVRPARPSAAESSGPTASGQQSPEGQDPSASTSAEPSVAVPEGLGIACSDANGTPVCCNEDGECWEHGIPDNTGAPPDGSTWEPVSLSNSPPARSSFGAAYDVARGRVVLFGGRGPGANYFGDTWEYDGNEWVDTSPATSPSSRRNHGLVYDESRRRIVLFGGWNEQVLGDTWEYDGNEWIEVETAKSPSPRDSYALAYDGARQLVVLFGGYETKNMKSDTWEYDGTNWKKVVTAHAPEARYSHRMAYDASRERVVLFGGRGGERTSTFSATPAPPDECRAKHGNEAFADTWEYDGVDWTPVSTSVAPHARWDHALAYDAARERVVLFGGLDSVCFAVFLGDTWEFTGTAWIPTGPTARPSRRFRHSMTYDITRERVVLFGGIASELLADTWEYAGP